MRKRVLPPERFVRFCGSDCTGCEAYKRFLIGDEKWLVNSKSGYRCCWLPKDYPRGIDCEIRICCEEKEIEYCGECPQFEDCTRIKQFYSKPGYDVLRKRMLRVLRRRGANLRLSS